MKKALAIVLSLTMLTAVGCGTKNEDIIGGADKPTSIYLENSNETKEEKITDELALNAIKNYCHSNNPDLKEMVSDDNYTMYWEIESSDDSQIVVLYRAYTGALVRYYIDAKTGDTYVNEYVPGITDEEEKIDESFNVKDYFSEPAEESERTKDDNARIDDSTSIFEGDMLEKAKQLSGAPCAEVDSVTEDGLLVIHLYEELEDHVATYDWYTVNPDTLMGENMMGEQIDLN